MSSITPSPTESPQDEHGLRPTYEELCQNTRLLIKFRWVAGGAILLSTLFARFIIDIHLKIFPLLIIGLVVLGYNVLLRLFVARDEEESLQRVQQVAWGQIILDWLAMIALLHFHRRDHQPGADLFRDSRRAVRHDPAALADAQPGPAGDR